MSDDSILAQVEQAVNRIDARLDRHIHAEEAELKKQVEGLSRIEEMMAEHGRLTNLVADAIPGRKFEYHHNTHDNEWKEREKWDRRKESWATDVGSWVLKGLLTVIGLALLAGTLQYLQLWIKP